MSEVNELAKARTRLAAERTLLAWVQSALLLMGSGIAIDQLARNLSHVFPAKQPYVSEAAASIIGLGALGASVLLLVLATLQYPVKLRSLAAPQTPVPQVNLAVAIWAVLTFGLAALLILIFTLGGF